MHYFKQFDSYINQILTHFKRYKNFISVCNILTGKRIFARVSSL